MSLVNFDIVSRNGHYEVLIEGEFYCSADTVIEATKELEAFLEELREGELSERTAV